MTFLQRTTCYHNDEYAKMAVGWFSSGTGAAGLVGAGLWWELRGLGVRTGISISSVSPFSPLVGRDDHDNLFSFTLCKVLPICMGLVYFFLLPKSAIFRSQNSSYMPISTFEDDNDESAPNQPRYVSSRSEQDDDEDIVNDTATIMLPQTPGTGAFDTAIPILKPNLSSKEKMEIAKHLIWPFMIPLFVVYFAEVSKSKQEWERQLCITHFATMRNS